MAEQPDTDRAAEENAEQGPERQKPRLVRRLLQPKWLLLLLALSAVGHVIGFTCSWLRATPPSGDLGQEVSLGVFRFTAEPEATGEIASAEFHLHIALLDEVAAAARRELSAKRLRVEQAVEELIRRAHGGDFDDPLLSGLKHQLQEEINETLGIRVIDDVIITDLVLERREGQIGTIAETAEARPQPESLPELEQPATQRGALHLTGQ